jgi:hypothetical protein
MPPSRPQATYDDVNLILRLYDMRREEKLREARAWFVANCRAESYAELMQKFPVGSADNAKYRMVISYWDMAASFIAGGVLKEDLFFESSREMLICYVRLGKIIPEIRHTNSDPFAFHNLEEVSKRYIAWLNNRAPGSYEAFAKRLA